MINGESTFTEKQWERLTDQLLLPPRQQQVIRLLLDGRSDRQIADEIGLAVPTVRSHLGRIYAKFSVQDRTELVIYVFRAFINMNGIVKDDVADDGNGIDPLCHT